MTPPASTRCSAARCDAIDNLPTGQIAQVQGNSQLKVLISHTGQWQPFTMRVDQAPFYDVRVRQAMRLIVDRPQMVEQVLSGQGRVANDMYSPFDPGYPSNLPQRHQDLEQAKSLLKRPATPGSPCSSPPPRCSRAWSRPRRCSPSRRPAPGSTSSSRSSTPARSTGPNYLKWTFAQDFWATRMYLPQVAQGSLPNSPFNETHWADPKFQKLIQQARAELDATKRNQIIGQAMTIEYNTGGYIIPYFSNQIDAYSSKLAGFVEAKSGFPLGNYWFKNVGFTVLSADETDGRPPMSQVPAPTGPAGAADAVPGLGGRVRGHPGAARQRGAGASSAATPRRRGWRR